MYNYNEIRDVHLELSTRCNASCPGCPRNLYGADVKTDYPLYSMSLEDAQKIFDKQFITQLSTVLINGNLGDFVLAKDNVKIVRYFIENNPEIKITISTNASTKANIWEELANLGVTVHFCIDGLADTHSLYRQNTDWNLIIENAKKFISVGKGHASWKMIRFNHNEHQIEECRKLSQELGFSYFMLKEDGRDIFPVFDRKGNYKHDIGDVTIPRDFNYHMKEYKTQLMTKLETTTPNGKPIKIACEVQERKSIYVSATGEVSPCCYLGFFPKEMALGVNKEISPLMSTENNAKVVGLEKAIDWFNNVSETFEKTPITICSKVCGVK